jgi:hypothetical protein
LAVNGRTLSWAEVNLVFIDSERNLKIGKRGSLLLWASVPVRKIPNIAVFRALVERHIAVGSAKPPMFP